MKRVDIVQYSREYSLTDKEVKEAIREHLEEEHTVFVSHDDIKILEDGSCLITLIDNRTAKEVKK